jgi:hypothetical protein
MSSGLAASDLPEIGTIDGTSAITDAMLPAAIAATTGTAEGRSAATLWNIFGLADFAVAITMGIITSPGPLIVPDVQSIGAGDYLGVLTPAFAKLNPAARAVAAPAAPP